jgi:hypothetical protein
MACFQLINFSIAVQFVTDRKRLEFGADLNCKFKFGIPCPVVGGGALLRLVSFSPRDLVSCVSARLRASAQSVTITEISISDPW